MTLGREKAIEYITTKEEECIQHLSTNINVPTLIAAGPFLVIRNAWEKYVATFNPEIIYLQKSPESIYIDLCKRKQDQKEKLDCNNPNFGSWDLDVTTEKINGTYQDISDADSLKNIKTHLSNITPLYTKYGKETHDSDVLKNDTNKSNLLVKTLVDKLR